MEDTGRLLSYRQARRLRPKAFVYGFPLDNAGVKYCGNKIGPIPPDVTGHELEIARLVQAEAISKHVVAACATAWPVERLQTVLGYREGKHYSLIAVAACTRPNTDQFIPRGEALGKLKEILANDGFKQEPQWFVKG